MAFVDLFFPGTGMTYDHIVNLCTVGFDRLWKKKILEKIPGQPLRILDQACGTGILTFGIARRFPPCRVTGVDVSREYLALASEKARTMGHGKVAFIEGRAEDVSLEPGFDCITSSYLAKYADLGVLVENAGRMLRHGGTLIMHDFAYPSNRVCRALWQLHFKVLQTMGARAYPEWKSAFDGLPALIRERNWIEELTGHLRRNGFSSVTAEALTFGAAALVTAKKGPPVPGTS